MADDRMLLICTVCEAEGQSPSDASIVVAKRGLDGFYITTGDFAVRNDKGELEWREQPGLYKKQMEEWLDAHTHLESEAGPNHFRLGYESEE